MKLELPSSSTNFLHISEYYARNQQSVRKRKKKVNLSFTRRKHHLSNGSAMYGTLATYTCRIRSREKRTYNFTDVLKISLLLNLLGLSAITKPAAID